MSDIADRGYVHPDVLVSTDWVAEHPNDPKVRIVESNEDPLLYRLGPHPRRRGGRLDRRPERPAAPRLPRPRRLREADARASASPATPPSSSTATRTTGGRPTPSGCSSSSATPTRKVMDGGRLKWEKEGRALTTRRAELPAPPSYTAPRARRRARSAPSATRCCKHADGKKPLVDVRSPAGVHRRAHAHAGVPARGRAARRPHPRRQERAVGARRQPRGRHVQDRRRAAAIYEEEKGLKPRRRRRRLLPHRRAQQPHLVRAHLPARLSRTCATTTAAGPSGATWWACRSRSRPDSCRPGKLQALLDVFAG